MSRIITNGDDWMRDMEKRVTREERRPAPPSFADQLGPGVTQRARAIMDWSDPGVLRNGWYYSEPLSLNTPDYDTPWIGETIVTFDGRGVQKLSSMTDDRKFQRRFSFGSSAVPTFTAWQHTGGAPEQANLTPWGTGNWTNGGLQVLRDGNTVTLVVNVTALSNQAGGAAVCALPLRYQPSALLASNLYFYAADSGTGAPNLMYVNYTGLYHTFARNTGQGTLGFATYVTPNPW
jgi:hypothetical protein